MIYSLPATTFEATVQGAATGLTGTLTVQVLDTPGATVVIPATTAGISESPAGSGIYSVALTAPSDKGTYLVVWYDGTSYTAEELTVTYNIPNATATPDSLVSLEVFKESIGETGTDNDDLYTRMLTAASQAVLNFTDRDFNTDTVLETREVEQPDRGLIIDIDDATEVIDVDGLGGVGWRAGSEGPAAAAGVFTYIEVAAFSPSSPLMGFTRNEDVFGPGWGNPIEVTAEWGWPAVPADVVQAVIWIAEDFVGDRSNASGALAAKSVAEVAENYMQQSQQRSPSDSEPISVRARGLLLPYRRVTL